MTRAEPSTPGTQASKDVLALAELGGLASSPARGALAAEEARDLAALVHGGIPVARGWLVSLGGPAPEERVSRWLSERLPFESGAALLRARPVYPTRAMHARFGRQGAGAFTVRPGDDLLAAARGALARLRTSELLAALGGTLDALTLRIIVEDAGPAGRAASADPVDGDPDVVRVYDATAAPWIVDRRTTRVTHKGEGALDGPSASLVADLADRAQLVLGLPVEIDWCTSGGRLAVGGVRRLELVPRFTPAPYRIVALVAPDEGTVAPLAVDGLDRALREEDGGEDVTVRRLYARPYRLHEHQGSRGRGDATSIARASASAAAILLDVAAPVTAARRFDRALRERLAGFDGARLERLSTAELLAELRARQLACVEAIRLLDHLRIASLTALGALEGAVGKLPAECIPALAMPRVTRARRRAHEQLERLRARLEEEPAGLAPSPALSPAARRELAKVRVALADLRPLGLDVRQVAFGESDEILLEALRASPWVRVAALERARRDAGRRLLATARGKSLGRVRGALVASLVGLLGRVALAKGQVADGLAAASLRLRRAACEAGARLVEAGLVDEPEDALYLHLAEICDGLEGEPGAYAARVRLRREDDARWAAFEAPRRIERRRGPA